MRVGRLAIVVAVLAVLSLATLFAAYRLVSSKAFQLSGEIVPQVETSEKVVALTFDDGPAPDYTEEVLKMLDEEDIKDTFFLTGEELERYPEEGERISAASHELGNHSYSHERMVLVSEAFVGREVKETDRLIHMTGYEG